MIDSTRGISGDTSSRRSNSINGQPMPKRSMTKAIHSSTTQRYVLALFLVAALSFMAYLTMHRVISEQEHLALVVNVSGRQRMLSQRIALLSEVISAAPKEQIESIERDRDAAIDLFERNHRDLSGGSSELGQPVAAVRDLYFGSMALDRDVADFIATARRLKPRSEISHEETVRLRELLRDEALHRLLPKLDRVVEYNQKHSDMQIKNLHEVEISILIFTLVLLALEATLIFRPMAQKISALLNQAYEAESAAIEASYEKSNFLATITHEIRSPLTAVVGMTESLLETSLRDEQRERLEIVQRVTDGLISMINDLLDYSKIESGKLTLETIPFEFQSLLFDTETLFQSSALKKGVRLSVDSQLSSPLEVFGDPTRIRQVITNFVSNAIKFTDPGGIVIVRTMILESDRPSEIMQSDGPHSFGRAKMRIEVIDSGIGIPTDSQAAIFERYTQADASTTRHYGGTGLGLSICKQIVEIMHGAIGFSSVQNQGSTFWFEIDLALQSQAALTVKANAPATAARAHLPNYTGKRVLIAEDNIVNLKVLVSQLEKFGFEVKSVTNGREAVRVYSEEPFDFMVLDCEMPGLDGHQALVKIRALEASQNRPHTPTLILTGHYANDIRSQFVSLGETTIATKPLKTPELAAVILGIIPAAKNAA